MLVDDLDHTLKELVKLVDIHVQGDQGLLPIILLHLFWRLRSRERIPHIALGDT
jgi:hypothetical protein